MPRYNRLIILIQDAARTIAKLRGLDVKDEIVQNEIDFMKNEEHHYKTIENITFWSVCEYIKCFVVVYGAKIMRIIITFCVEFKFSS